MNGLLSLRGDPKRLPNSETPSSGSKENDA